MKFTWNKGQLEYDSKMKEAKRSLQKLPRVLTRLFNSTVPAAANFKKRFGDQKNVRCIVTRHKLGFENEISLQRLTTLLDKFFKDDSYIAERTFMIDFDITLDFATGFDPDLLEEFSKRKKELNLICGCDRPSTFTVKTFSDSHVSHLEENAAIYESKVYNKFMYYALVGADITQNIASSLSKWLLNPSEVLQARNKASLETGYTRLELRFEHLLFEDCGYYENCLNEAMDMLLVDSDSLRIQPINQQWQALVNHCVTNSLLYIDQDHDYIVIAWFKDWAFKQKRLCGYE